MKRLIAASVLALALGGLSPATTATAVKNCYNIKASEKDFAAKMNLARSASGVGRLHLDRELSKVARRHAWEMENKNTLYHTPSSKLRWRVTRWNMLGENVGVGGDVASLHRAFMQSPAHRANVMRSSYQHVGVGVHRDNNYMWVTIVFESHRDPGTRLRLCR